LWVRPETFAYRRAAPRLLVPTEAATWSTWPRQALMSNGSAIGAVDVGLAHAADPSGVTDRVRPRQRAA
jgi:hypothetical protein